NDDNRLAYVLGHELAHNARLHIEAKQMNRLLASVAALVIEAGTGMDFSGLLDDIGMSAWSQDFESEADYIGLYMMARAGYDPAEGIQFARRLAALYPETIHLAASSHPSSAKRFVALNKTLAEIHTAKAARRPLIPLEK
ncbi:MAG: peptidase M48, partial [Micavibrio aeruginosavorus]